VVVGDLFVATQIAKFPIFPEHTTRNGGEDIPEQPFTFSESLFGLTASRDIADESHAQTAAVGLDPGVTNFGREDGAVVAAVETLAGQTVLVGGLRVGTLQLELGQMATPELLPRVAEALASPGIDIHHITLGIQAE
jgi:hypothetical protein